MYETFFVFSIFFENWRGLIKSNILNIYIHRMSLIKSSPYFSRKRLEIGEDIEKNIYFQNIVGFKRSIYKVYHFDLGWRWQGQRKIILNFLNGITIFFYINWFLVIFCIRSYKSKMIKKWLDYKIFYILVWHNLT